MKHTDAEIEDAARRFEQLADNLDPASVAAEDLSDLRAVAEAAEQARRDEALVTERVAAAGGASPRAELEQDRGRARRIPAGRSSPVC